MLTVACLFSLSLHRTDLVICAKQYAHIYLNGCALLPPVPVGNLQIELVHAEIPKSLSKEIAKTNSNLINYVCWFIILSHLLFCFSLFWDLGLTSVVKWGPGPNNVKKEINTVKKQHQKGDHFHKNYMYFVMGFFVGFWRSPGKCFFSLWWPKCSKWGLLGDTFPDMSQQSWTTENCGFVYTDDYVLQFWGAGLGRVGQLFSRFFLRCVWRCDFTIFSKIEGPAGSSKDVVWWAFQVQVLHRFFYEFPMNNRIPCQARDAGDLRHPGALQSIYRSWKLDMLSQTGGKMNADEQKQT